MGLQMSTLRFWIAIWHPEDIILTLERYKMTCKGYMTHLVIFWHQNVNDTLGLFVKKNNDFRIKASVST